MRFSLVIAFLMVAGLAGLTAGTPPPRAAASETPAGASTERPAPEPEWAGLSNYREDNARLAAPAAGEKRVVFLGDSITAGWGADGNFFPGRPYLNRGISGQTTAQMLVRFRQDVIRLQPAVVVILAGTNDIAGNGGPVTVEAIEDNLQSMAELAGGHGIRVVFSSVLPVLDYPWRPGLHPADKISALNRWIAAYCAQHQLVYLDYYSAMVDQGGGMRPDLSGDGVHPAKAGYALMAPLVENAIHQALN